MGDHHQGGQVTARGVAPLTPGAREAAAAAAREADEAAIRAALAASSGNVGRAARALEVSRRSLDERITHLGLRTWLRDAYPYSVGQPRRDAPAPEAGPGGEAPAARDTTTATKRPRGRPRKIDRAPEKESGQ